MAQYLLSVFHEPGVHAAGTAYQSEEDMQAAFARVGAFNEGLQTSGAFVFACGLTPPEQAVTIAPDGARRQGPFAPDAPAFTGGFWVVEATDDAAAFALGAEGAAACGQRVEVRPLQG